MNSKVKKIIAREGLVLLAFIGVAYILSGFFVTTPFGRLEMLVVYSYLLYLLFRFVVQSKFPKRIVGYVSLIASIILFIIYTRAVMLTAIKSMSKYSAEAWFAIIFASPVFLGVTVILFSIGIYFLVKQ